MIKNVRFESVIDTEVGKVVPVMIEGETRNVVQKEMSRIVSQVVNGVSAFRSPRFEDGRWFSTGFYTWSEGNEKI